MLEKLKDVDWASIPGPELYRPGDVADAVRGLAGFKWFQWFKWKSSRALDNALSTFGNNHRGTYYPVILTVIPFLREILLAGDSDAQMSTMCVLDDFTYFDPEPDLFELPDGRREPLELHFRRAMQSLRPMFETVAATGVSDKVRNLANTLLERLSELENIES